MLNRLSIFQKLFYFLLLMVGIFVIAFWSIYNLNVKDIQLEMSRNKMNDVRLMASQLSTQFEQVLANTITLSQDSSIRDYPYTLKFGDKYSRYEGKLSIIDKLAINTASTSWNNRVTLYYMDEQELVSSANSSSIAPLDLSASKVNEWTVHMDEGGSGYYSYMMKTHISELLIEVSFSLKNLEKMMEPYNSGTPLMYDAGQSVFIRKESRFLEDAYPKIASEISGESGSFLFQDQGTEYLVHYMKCAMLDLYFLDFHPRSQFIRPISRNNQYFIYAVLIVVAGVIFYTLLLRRQVQKPVNVLRRAINRFDRGDLSSRVATLHAHEFRMLGNSFNRMAENTQRLIEQVLFYELEVKEAKLKQYQAQINPHFLFNCLNYIQSKASVRDHQAVTAMTLHLGSYCRYVQKIELIDSTLLEEITFVEHFLSIIQLRKREISFDIHIPEHMYGYRVPRMILQPLVENCIKHGIEPGTEQGVVTITAEDTEHGFQITVKDNGAGMTEGRLLAVRRHMNDSIHQDETLGTGIRNVNQRIRLYFGKSSGLAVESMPLGGTCYRIHIDNAEDNNAANSAG